MTWWQEIHEPKASEPWAASWGITAPWAHPIWSQYVIYLYDLTTPTEKPPVIYLPGATHEFLLYAVDSQHPLDPKKSFATQKIHTLQPGNYGYQMRCADNYAAVDRVQASVDQIAARTLSPDTDFRRAWDVLFHDCYALAGAIAAAAPGSRAQ